MIATDMQLPDWVNWIAQDYSGAWWGFEVEPNQSFDCWYENEIGRCIRLAQGPVNPDWCNSLQSRADSLI